MPMETRSVSTGTVDFVVGVDKKLWVGSGLFENFKSFFSTQGTVFGSESFDHTDWIALPDDAAGYSFTLVGWGGIGFLACVKPPTLLLLTHFPGTFPVMHSN